MFTLPRPRSFTLSLAELVNAILRPEKELSIPTPSISTFREFRRVPSIVVQRITANPRRCVWMPCTAAILRDREIYIERSAQRWSIVCALARTVLIGYKHQQPKVSSRPTTSQRLQIRRCMGYLPLL